MRSLSGGGIARCSCGGNDGSEIRFVVAGNGIDGFRDGKLHDRRIPCLSKWVRAVGDRGVDGDGVPVEDGIGVAKAEPSRRTIALVMQVKTLLFITDLRVVELWWRGKFQALLGTKPLTKQVLLAVGPG